MIKDGWTLTDAPVAAASETLQASIESAKVKVQEDTIEGILTAIPSSEPDKDLNAGILSKVNAARRALFNRWCKQNALTPNRATLLVWLELGHQGWCKVALNHEISLMSEAAAQTHYEMQTTPFESDKTQYPAIREVSKLVLPYIQEGRYDEFVALCKGNKTTQDIIRIAFGLEVKSGQKRSIENVAKQFGYKVTLVKNANGVRTYRFVDLLGSVAEHRVAPASTPVEFDVVRLMDAADATKISPESDPKEPAEAFTLTTDPSEPDGEPVGWEW